MFIHSNVKDHLISDLLHLKCCLFFFLLNSINVLCKFCTLNFTNTSSSTKNMQIVLGLGGFQISLILKYILTAGYKRHFLIFLVPEQNIFSIKIKIATSWMLISFCEKLYHTTRKDHPFREKYCVKEDYSLSSVIERHSTWSQKKNQNTHLNVNIVKRIGQKNSLRTVKNY